MDINKVTAIMKAVPTCACMATHALTYTPIMFTLTGRGLGAISRRKERRMGEDGCRNERHTQNGGRAARDGVTNKRKRSVEHERPQDFHYRGRREFTWTREKRQKSEGASCRTYASM